MGDLYEATRDLMETDFTQTVHKTAYPAISPTRPELDQSGQTVLITGGGTGIGKSIAEHFILASASTIIIVGRRIDVLEAAAQDLTGKARLANKTTSIMSRACDVADKVAVAALWDELEKRNLLVDVVVLNAAKFSEAKSFLEYGPDEIWSQVQANFEAPIRMTDRFMRQCAGKKKFLINVTSGVIHALQHPMVKQRATYALSKASAALYVQLLADQVPIDQLQVVTFHPGMVWPSGYEAMGLTRDMLPFDEVDLPGAFAVWAASEQAAFANGRIVWATWDVEELASGEVARRMAEEYTYLRVGVTGIDIAKKA